MAVFRFMAVVLIVLGLMLLGADVVSMLERGGEPHVRSLFEIWALFSATGVEAFKAWVADGLPQPLPDGITTVLGLPAFGCFLVLGVGLAFLFRQSEELGE
ncbi:MAG: hypothetical protein K8S25_12010 [Alphaproteobacteria bacterium]|nr:hypothetical protein [Alphaproteobacteria bacterium]